MKTPDLSIIIASFNTKDILKNCIESIHVSTKTVSCEIIVVDNASTDGSPDMVEECFRDARLIRNSENLMFAKANNQAIAIAGGRNLLFLNSDTIVENGSLVAMLRFLDGHPDAAAVGPKVLNVDGTLQSKGFWFPSIGLVLLRLSGLNKILSMTAKRKYFPGYFWDENETRTVDWISGCCMLIRKSVVEKIGGFCEGFYFGGEDGEWCFRAMKHGYRVWYYPEAAIRHIGGASRVKFDDDIILESHLLHWVTNNGVGYGVVYEFLELLSGSLRYALSFLPDRGADYRRTISSDLRLGRKKAMRLLGMIMKVRRSAEGTCAKG